MANRAVLMIGNYLPQPKYNKNIWQFLAERLSTHGWRVITTSSKENQVVRLIDMLHTVWRYRQKYQLAQIDVFSGKAFFFAQVCSWLLKILRKPIILTLHGGGLAEFAQTNPRKVSSLFQRASVVVTPSPFLQHALSSFHPDIRHIPNPIDASAAIVRLRQNPRPILVWVRAFHQIYNPNLAVQSIALLAPDFPDLRLLMIGPDKGDGSLSQFIQEASTLSVDQNIELIGPLYHEDVLAWLDKADIFINTTNFDAAPRSVLEAMANGLCVVSTNVGGVPYIIEDGKDGLLVPPGEPELMAAEIRKILTDHQLAEMLSKNARSKAIQYDWSSILPQWLALLQEVTDQDNG
ncbi:MAG TPA: glycosyltransferase family 4 protein [Chloroflexi bacterium]|nr:glycosyltransferase family 4 protein [Chloroflexota bacterium]